MKTASFLRNVALFAGLSDQLLGVLAGQVTEVRVRAGEWILREGEAGHSLLVVRSGRVEVVHEGPPEALLRVLRRGDVLGELALLRDQPRSASARALRDTELLELGREQFELLIETAPSFAVGLTRSMGAQLAASRTPIVSATPPRTIAVVGLDPSLPVPEVAESLADEFARWGRVARLRGGDLAAIDRAEQDAERVVMTGGADPTQAWTDLCVREADLVLALSRGGVAAPWAAQLSALQGCELLVLSPAVSTAAIEQLAPREVQVVGSSARACEALAATARRMAGRSLGVVLSGGGARALAHLGALEELLAAGVVFDRVAGVSLGSLVGAAFAAGLSAEAAQETARRTFVDANPSNDFVPPVYSMIRGVKARRMIGEVFGSRRIEELPRRFFSVSCDLVTRNPVVHRTGPVADAVYPSLAVPGVFPPVSAPGGRLLVDGGVLDNLPVATMARTGEGPVLAIDVTGRVGRFRAVERGRLGALRPSLRRMLTGSAAAVPRLSETLVRTVMVGSADTVMAARQHADVVVSPRVEGIPLMDWKALPRVLELGREAARAVLADQDARTRLNL